ncbi:hypothetical protein SNE40_022663 [Patella caerulea]
MSGQTTEITDPENPKAEPRKFAFDHSYWSHDGFNEREDGYLEPAGAKYDDQQKVFEDLGKGVLDNAWKGYNCSLFAYGQTGSGKSYSMVGYGVNKGIVPLACEDLFRGISAKRESAVKDEEYQVTLSMLEIYNEQVRDLLNLKTLQKGGLKVRQHPTKGFYVESQSNWPVDSYDEINNKINEGTRNRTVASTNMNATSSRAHTIVAVSFVQKSSNEAGQNMTKTSVINLVDLAGSERAESTGATGDRLKEGSAINQSLSSLGNCIKALADISQGKKKVVVPFRDSVLTKLLQNALGGNSKTVMIAALSPADINYEETLSTLRFADRAKAIKTSAIVNESPTDKLIRELREENQRLMDMLKSGGGGASLEMGGGGQGKSGYSEDEVAEMKRALEEQVRQNAQELEDMKKSWAEKMQEGQQQTMAGMAQENKEHEEMKTTPHFWNLNEDPALTRMIIHFCRAGESKIGNRKADPAPEILLNGLSIQKEHAVITNNNNTVKIRPQVSAKVMVNGQEIKSETTLHHNDRVMFGSNLLFAFHHPQELEKQVKEGIKIETPTYDSAQEEIAQKSGLMKDIGGADGKSKEDLLLQEDLIQLLPMINEANAMSEELDKKVIFEIALVSSQARGVQDGKTEVMVKMRNMENENEWMFSRNDFINRKYLMQEMYANYMQGDADWDVPKERDPFWEPADTETLIGTVHVYLQSLGYMIELQENLAIADYKGVEQGHLTVEVQPCSEKWDNIEEDYFVDNPAELVGKKIYFKLKIPFARGLPQRFVQSFCRYKFYLEDKDVQTQVVSGTINPDFGHEKKYQLDVTKQLIEYIANSPLVIEIWGMQKGDSSPSKASTNNKNNKNNKTKALMKREKTIVNSPTTVTVSKDEKIKEEEEKYKSASEVNMYKKKAEKEEAKIHKIQEFLDSAKASGQTTIQISDIEKMLSLESNGATVGTTQKNNTNNKNDRGATKTSKACIIQ